MFTLSLKQYHMAGKEEFHLVVNALLKVMGRWRKEESLFNFWELRESSISGNIDLNYYYEF